MGRQAIITPQNYNAIRSYALEHGRSATIAHYKISRSTYDRVRCYATYTIYKHAQIDGSRKHYAKRKAERQQTLSDPFGNAPKPPVIIPPQQPAVEDKNGPVIVKPLVNIAPQTLDEYRRENADLRIKAGNLEFELEQTKKELEASHDNYQKLSKQYDHLWEELEETKKKTNQTDTENLSNEETNLLNASQALFNLNHPSVRDHNNKPTQVEIVIGGAKITITQEG